MANEITKTYIINLALANLGQDVIASADEDTATARSANLMYDVVRRDLLRAHDWQFALRFAELAASNTASPELRLPYVFALPSGCLFLKKIVYENIPVQKTVPHLLFNDNSGNKLVAVPYEEARAWYVYDEDNTYVFDPAFVACFALLLAAELAVPLAGDYELAKYMLAKYQSKLDEARQANKIEQFEVPEKTSPLVEAR